MSIFARAARFARSAQGKRLMRQASQYAKSPQGRKQIQRVVDGAKSRRGGGASSRPKKRARW